MRIRFGSASDIGKARDRNEDSFLADPPVFAVADGMGGHKGGDVASSLAIQVLEGDALPADGAELVERVREANLAVANGLFLVLLFLGGMAYPLAKLPDALETVAKALPAAALSETVRAVLTPGKAFPTGELVVLLIWAVAAPLAAARWFRWEE